MNYRDRLNEKTAKGLVGLTLLVAGEHAETIGNSIIALFSDKDTLPPHGAIFTMVVHPGTVQGDDAINVVVEELNRSVPEFLAMEVANDSDAQR